MFCMLFSCYIELFMNQFSLYKRIPISEVICPLKQTYVIFDFESFGFSDISNKQRAFTHLLCNAKLFLCLFNHLSLTFWIDLYLILIIKKHPLEIILFVHSFIVKLLEQFLMERSWERKWNIKWHRTKILKS